MTTTQNVAIERMARIARAFPFSAAALFVAAAFLVRLLLDPWLGENHAFGAFYPAIFGGAYLLGRSPAYFASVLAGVGGQWAFLHPRFGWKFDTQDFASLLFFAITVGAGVWLITSLTNAQRRSKAVSDGPAELSVAPRAQTGCEIPDEVSRAEFSLLMEDAIAEVDADLTSARASDPSSTPPLTLHDWWEHLSLVVMPELLLQRPAKRSWGYY